jgi:hypothetical protein
MEDGMDKQEAQQELAKLTKRQAERMAYHQAEIARRQQSECL